MDTWISSSASATWAFKLVAADEAFPGFPRYIPAGEHNRAFGNIFWANFDAQRDAAQLPFVEFEARSDLVAGIQFERGSPAKAHP